MPWAVWWSVARRLGSERELERRSVGASAASESRASSQEWRRRSRVQRESRPRTNWRSSRRRHGAWQEVTRSARWARGWPWSAAVSSAVVAVAARSSKASSSGTREGLGAMVCWSLSRNEARLWMAFLPAKAAKEGAWSSVCLEASRQEETRKEREAWALSSQPSRRSTARWAAQARRPEARATRQARAPAALRQSSSTTEGGGSITEAVGSRTSSTGPRAARTRPKTRTTASAA
mmetsp:Transcript_12515/g.39747  ORF Transcript_12515/g.39747 Transcript_12515/m.39747 type:complete len:235 (+) Transcript_12515:299-1003(+)